ncbi:MAG: MinD/ParA family protein, partial [Acidimicrobiia bacterium]
VGALRALVPEAGVDERFGQLVAGLDLDVDPGAASAVVAVALAAAASERRSVVLVDVDEVNPGVARRLGLALHPHLLDALDAVHAGPGTDAADPLGDALARPALGPAGRLGFDVITGLANRDDWALARGGDVAALLDALRARWGVVVVNLGPHLEDLTRWVDRFGASRAALGVADAVVGVCEASPRGVLRFLDWLAEASALVPSRPVHVVVNRVPRSAFRAAEVLERLRADAGGRLASVDLVPEDPAVRRAEWAGEVVGGRRFRRAVAVVETRLFSPAPATAAAGGTP